ncbi:hypothetical protein [Streptomyces sp. NPDC001076]
MSRPLPRGGTFLPAAIAVPAVAALLLDAFGRQGTSLTALSALLLATALGRR